MKNSRAYNNLTLIKALEEVSEEKAIEAVSRADVDGEELSKLIEWSIMGKVVNKDTKEPLKLGKKVIAAAMLNRIKQIARDKNIK